MWSQADESRCLQRPAALVSLKQASKELNMPFVSVRITRDGVTREQKAQVIAEITDTLQRVLGKRPDLTHIVIEEVDTDNWGYAGITTTEYRKNQPG
jgi:4-oxalocrotonate tautomerase